MSRVSTPSTDRRGSTDQSHLTIGQLAECSGAATSAIRYYESQGLLTSTRTAGNQRRYPRATLRRLGFIRAAQRVGLSLEEIRDALATLPDERTPTKRDWERLSRHWRRRLDDQIERLERLRDRLDGCIGCGCLSLRACALNNPGDELAAEGPGAVELEPGAGAPARGHALP
jgi:MerR family transcriptional regulator, redox-sensitive transcriptional activator SoxR